MAGTELRRRLTELAETFVQDVLAAIQNASLSDVAKEVSATGAAAGQALDREVTESPRRKLVRRRGEEIRRVKDEIVRVLERSHGPIGAAEIAREIGEETVALAFPMAQLRTAGLVRKEGERTQAVYSLAQRDDEDRERKRKKKKK